MVIMRNDFLRTGTYDLRHVYVFSGQLPDEVSVSVTSKHESVHDSLVNETAYGHIMLDLVGHRSNEVGASDALFHLIEMSRVVHEGAASYISLTMYKQEEMVSKLPQFYQAAFDKASRAVSCLEALRLFRCDMVFSLAKASMFPLFTTEQRNRYAHDLSVIYELTSPNDTFEQVCRVADLMDVEHILQQLHDHFDPRIIYCEDVDELIALVGDSNTAANILTLMGQFATILTDELLATELPHLEEMKSDHRMMSAVLKMTYKDTVDTNMAPTINDTWMYSSQYNAVIKAFRERVKIFDRAIPPPVDICRNDPELLVQTMQASLGALDCLYGYYSVNEKDSLLFITDTPRFSGRIAAYDLTVSEAKSIGKIDCRKVVLADERTLFWMLKRPGLEKLEALGNEVQLYFAVNEPGLPFLDLYIRQLKLKVKVYCFRQPYPGTTLDKGINLIIFEAEIGSSAVLFFQLATDIFVAGLKTYIEQVSPFSSLLTYETTNNVSEEVTISLSKLIDHPLYNYYLLDARPSVLDSFDFDDSGK